MTKKTLSILFAIVGIQLSAFANNFIEERD